MSTPAMPLPTVTPSIPAGDTDTAAPAADEHPQLDPAVVGLDTAQPVAGIDHFEQDHTGRLAPTVMLTFAAALSGVVGVLATPDVVRVAAFGLAVLLCLTAARVLTRHI